jgi:hypothetical protein
MLQAEYAFVTDVARRIRSGEFGGVSVWARLHELIAEGTSLEEVLGDPVRYLGEEARALGPAPPD